MCSADLFETARNDKFQISNDKSLFVFVGGTAEDIKEFKKEAEGLDNVLILGHKPHREIPYFLKAADVLVLPNKTGERLSEKYTSPLKLFEYMASGRPLVASDLSSLREILSEETAILVKSNDPRALAEGLRRALMDMELAESMAKRALDMVQQYSWHRRATSIINFLKP